MAYVVTNDAHYKNISRKIREKTNSSKNYCPSEMAQGIETVHEIGRETGRNIERKELWDNIQGYGNRTDYRNAFGSIGWNLATFKPVYDMHVENAYMMFYHHNRGNDAYDLEELLRNRGIILEFSKCTDFRYAFSNAFISHIGEIDVRNVEGGYLANMFHWNYWTKTVDKLIVDENVTFHNDTFRGFYALENITISGVIASNINFRDCENLTTESIISIFKALSDTTSASVTLNKTAIHNMDFAGTDYNSFEELKASKPNWIVVITYS